MLGIAEQRPLRQYQIVKRLLRCSSKFGEVPGGGYRAVREPRRRGSFFHAWPVKEKERAYRPPKAAKSPLLDSRLYDVDNVIANGVEHQIAHRMELQFPHDVRAMRLSSLNTQA